MSMKQINALRHRGEGDEVEVYIRRGKNAGWVKKSFLMGWLARHGLLKLV